jgi:prepilin-type N-terminal cleavage/methylation domain-containing protein
MKHLSSHKQGFTLVEIILAIAILGIVVALMTPVLLSGFQQIILSGERSKTGKEAVAAMESDLAEGLIPTANPTYSITIGDGVSVDSYLLSQFGTGENGTVTIDGYIPPNLPVVTLPSAPTSTPPPTPSPPASPTPEPPTPTLDPSVTATPTPIPSNTPIPTPTPAPPISYDAVQLDISDWSIASPYASLEHVTAQMQYRVLQDTTVILSWTTCTTSPMSVLLPNGASEYRVELRQNDNLANQKSISVRKAPQIRLVAQNPKKSYFEVYKENIGWVKVINEDKIQYARNGGTWVNISNNLLINKLGSSEFLYIRYSDGNDIIGITRHDPPSLYVQYP